MEICVFVTTHRSSAWTHKTQIQAMYLAPPPIAKDVSNLMRLLLRLAGGGLEQHLYNIMGEPRCAAAGAGAQMC